VVLAVNPGRLRQRADRARSKRREVAADACIRAEALQQPQNHPAAGPSVERGKWDELHEIAFRQLAGSTQTLALDNRIAHAEID